MIILSSLGHVWLIDLDGTILKHNGYKIDGADSLLPGAGEFLANLPPGDKIIFLTSRERKYENITREFLDHNGIRYDGIIFNLPYGERILINDMKPSGLKTALCVNIERDDGHFPKVEINENV